MRLRPPASSSDLEEARAIAERLARPLRPAAPAGPAAAAYVKFGVGAGASVPPAPVEAPGPPPVEPAAEAPAPPEWPEGAATESLVEEPGVAAAPEPELEEVPPATSEWPEGAAAESLVDEPLPEPLPEPIPEPAISAEPEGLEGLIQEVPIEEPPPPPPPPSWSSLLGQAREAAGAQAAMLIGPQGDLLAATDGWPAAGAAAIAGKLLPIVTPRLGTPDAFVPVRLSGHVLSVWRAAVVGGLVTVATLAEQALPAERRPAIDGQLALGSLDAARPAAT
jgi:hypothetical protein